MEMTYEYITPLVAKELLEKKGSNRKLSIATVQAYATDMANGNWTCKTGDAISLDKDGNVVNGQHRLAAIVKSGVGIHSWVCRGVESFGIYDLNRKRSARDQIVITRQDLEKVYSSSLYIAVAKALITRTTYGSQANRPVTPSEIMKFTDLHKQDLDKYFLNMPGEKVGKFYITVIHLALFMAFMDGVKMESIREFYDILRTGMNENPIGFPVVAYRNYVLNAPRVPINLDEIGRCQYALQKYLSKSCSKQTRVPSRGLIYPFPWNEKGLK